MPSPKDPSARDHFMYVVHANNYPFYVGHGRAGRLSDRARFIDSLVRLHPDPTYKKWELHGRVVSHVWAAGATVYFDQLTSHQTKVEAIRSEMQLLRELRAAGFLMSNVVGKPGVASESEIAKAVCSSGAAWDKLLTFTPISRFTRELLPRYNRVA
jgi:hypothetical protein